MESPKTLGPVDIEVNEFLNFATSRVRLIYFVCSAVILAVGLLDLVRGRSIFDAFAPTVVLLLLLTGLHFFSRSRMRKRIIALQDGMKGLSWTLNENHLLIQSPRSRSEMPWREQTKCALKANAIVLHNVGGMRYYMPTRGLANPAEAPNVVAWINERIRESKTS